MPDEKLKEFNVELQALLLKHNVNLQVSHGIQVVPRETISETTGTEEVKTNEPTSTN